MTDAPRKAALQDLLAKVEAGDETRASIEDAGVRVWPDGNDHFLFVLAASAYNGSLDAAKALHEAVLPGWGWTITDRKADYLSKCWRYDLTSLLWDATASDPARASLIAILKALIAQEEAAHD